MAYFLCYLFLYLLYRISNMATSSNEIVDSNLRFNITQKHLYGDYVCKTFNMFGAAEVTIKLYGKYFFVL